MKTRVLLQRTFFGQYLLTNWWLLGHTHQSAIKYLMHNFYSIMVQGTHTSMCRTKRSPCISLVTVQSWINSPTSHLCVIPLILYLFWATMLLNGNVEGWKKRLYPAGIFSEGNNSAIMFVVVMWAFWPENPALSLVKNSHATHFGGKIPNKKARWRSRSE